MDKRIFQIILFVAAGAFLGVVGTSFVVQPQVNALQQELKAVSAQMSILEKKFNQAQAEAQARKAQAQKEPDQENFSKVYSNLMIGNSPVKGDKDALVTIYEFADLQCPFCAKFYPVIDEVLKAYPGKVNFVIKNFPLSFHPNARSAAKLALAANEQKKYFEMVALLLQNGGDVSEGKIKEYAGKLRLNYKRLLKDYREKDPQWEKIIAGDLEEGRKADVRGTPTFYINGRKTRSRDLDSLKSDIDRLLWQKK